MVLRRKSRKILIREVYIPTLLIIKNLTFFDRKKPRIGSLIKSKAYAGELCKSFEDYIFDFMEELDEIEIKRIYDKVLVLYLDDNLNHF